MAPLHGRGRRGLPPQALVTSLAMRTCSGVGVPVKQVPQQPTAFPGHLSPGCAVLCPAWMRGAVSLADICSFRVVRQNPRKFKGF